MLSLPKREKGGETKCVGGRKRGGRGSHGLFFNLFEKREKKKYGKTQELHGPEGGKKRKGKATNSMSFPSAAGEKNEEKMKRILTRRIEKEEKGDASSFSSPVEEKAIGNRGPGEKEAPCHPAVFTYYLRTRGEGERIGGFSSETGTMTGEEGREKAEVSRP